MNTVATSLYRRSVTLVHKLDEGHRSLLLYWTMAVSFACGIRLSLASFSEMPATAQIVTALPYLLMVGAPVASLMLAFHWFRDGARLPQPDYRFARFGSWRNVEAAEARGHHLYGVTGIMASLLLGILMNIPVRTLEFLSAVPALGATPPDWFGMLYMMMLADVVLISSLYAIAFVAALRHVPLFPRLLAVIWGIDILMQIMIARTMGGMADLPVNVATALQMLLEGNLHKVLISMALWTPYLLLSRRVNITFRHRVPA